MTQQGDAVAGELATEKVGIKGYLAFFLTLELSNQVQRFFEVNFIRCFPT